MDEPSDKLRRFINTETNRAMWRTWLLLGNADMVWQMLNSDFIADEPLDDDMRSPLIDLALHQPENEAHAKKLAETVRALISKGASLRIADFKGLLPLDYALIGPNHFVARELFINTLRGNFLDQNMNPSYRPRIKTLFRTMPDSERKSAYKNLMTNVSALRDHFNRTIIEGDPYILGLHPDDHEFWQDFVPPPYGTLPRAPEKLSKQFQKIATITRQSKEPAPHNASPTNYAAWLEREKDIYRTIEWETVRKIKL